MDDSPSVPQKQCPRCEQFFPETADFFFRNKQSLSGLQNRCKKCQSIAVHGHPPRYYRNDIPEGFKRCPHCEQILAATPEFFSKATREKDGLYYCCKECRHARWHSKYPQPMKEEIPEGHKRCSKCKQVWLASHAFFCNDRNSPDRLTLWCRACLKHYRTQHRDERNQYHAQYSKEHRQEYRAYHKKYIKEYDRRPEVRERQRPQAVLKSSRRRALKNAAPGTLTAEQIQQKLRLQRYRCYYAACNHAKFERKNGAYVYHLEHTVPLSRTEANPRHDVNYVVLACPACNLSKHNKLPHEFFEGGRLF